MGRVKLSMELVEERGDAAGSLTKQGIRSINLWIRSKPLMEDGGQNKRVRKRFWRTQILVYYAMYPCLGVIDRENTDVRDRKNSKSGSNITSH
ncbi:uncharacterized protein G2W53_031474 [Senna tora]|uniref:Uncharacterized protein n=1 Tax=Senna tora TaxID=362788 RepID=A0A834WBT0_9FABA|nr:uncharacterized protein G2W53_031474 [Senna tora]